jgi:hypothetical protein
MAPSRARWRSRGRHHRQRAPAVCKGKPSPTKVRHFADSDLALAKSANHADQRWRVFLFKMATALKHQALVRDSQPRNRLGFRLSLRLCRSWSRKCVSPLFQVLFTQAQALPLCCLISPSVPWRSDFFGAGAGLGGPSHGFGFPSTTGRQAK